MAWRVAEWLNGGMRQRRNGLKHRRLRFEHLEDRRLLAIIADGFADSFVQVSWITGDFTGGRKGVRTI